MCDVPSDKIQARERHKKRNLFSPYVSLFLPSFSMPNIKDSHRCVRLKGQGDLNLKIGEHLLLCGTRKKKKLS